MKLRLVSVLLWLSAVSLAAFSQTFPIDCVNSSSCTSPNLPVFTGADVVTNSNLLQKPTGVIEDLAGLSIFGIIRVA